jgi:L-fuconate dehydratase
MKNCVIQSVRIVDARFALPDGAGSDSVHTRPEYCMPVTRLASDRQISGTGIALTLGDGNRLVCEAIDLLAKPLAGLEINELMSTFGIFSRRLADDPSLRWLGPHKGVVHLALASLTNACFDLWAKSRAVPLWKLLLDLTPEEIVAVLDLSYIEDALSEQDALAILRAQVLSRGTHGEARSAMLPTQPYEADQRKGGNDAELTGENTDYKRRCGVQPDQIVTQPEQR